MVKHVFKENLVDFQRAQLGLLLLFFSDNEEFVHLNEFGLLSQATIHLEILRLGPEGIFGEVLDADEGLFLRQVVLGVFVPTQALNCSRVAYSSLIVSAIFEFDYACLEVILGELPVELAHCIIARSVERRQNRLHVFISLIHILLPQYILDKLILCSISAQFRYFSEPSVRLTFVLGEGLADA